MNVWEQVLARIETKVNRHSFYTWFKPTSLVSDTGVSVTVRVPNGLFKEWLHKHYSGVLAEALAEVKRPDLDVQFVADAPTDPASVALGPEEAAALQQPSQAATPVPTTTHAGLNPRYTFDSFIVGSSNQFAHAASRAVARSAPGVVRVRRRGWRKSPWALRKRRTVA